MVNLFKRTAKKRLVFFVLSDAVFVFLSIWISFMLRFDSQIPSQYMSLVVMTSVLAILILIPIFYSQKLYSFSWSYVSTNELVSLFKATTVSFVVLGAIVYILKQFTTFQVFPRSIILISYLLVFLFTGGMRLSKRIYLDIFDSRKVIEREKTLIVGAGDAGEQMLRNISSSRSSYSPVGFVDDNPVKRGVKIHGVKVLGKVSDMPRIIKEHDIKKLIIALPSDNSKAIREAVELGRNAGVRNIKIAPPLSEIMRGEISLKNLKGVDVADLLGRESVDLDRKQIENFIKDKVVLVTGAAGSIGSELSKQVASFGPSLLVLLDQDETGIFNISKELYRTYASLKMESLVSDVKDSEKIHNVFKKFKPQIVFHAAAYKHVPLMEQYPDEAVKDNIFGTEILAKASTEYGAEKFIFISTDKAVNPTSVMGATKRVGEMICQAYNQKNTTKFISVRFGNVLDSRGSVIPIFREQIRKGGPVEVTHKDMERYFMLNSEACLLVMQAGAMGQGGEVFVLDMGKSVKILDLAKEMIRLSGFEVDKDIAITFIGTRPGEKLFEEILTAEEGTLVTQNQKIFMAKMSGVDVSHLDEKLTYLRNSIDEIGNQEIIETLKSFTPYYK